MRKIPVMLCVGARPNFMKAAPLLEALKRERVFAPFLLHTGQHYDISMNDQIFTDLRLPAPDAFLGVGSGTQAGQTAAIMKKFEKTLLTEKPRLVIVVGDVNSTLACTLTAVKMGIPVAHVEAGLRSGDMSMPEEINRLVTDRISDLLFTTSQDANENLVREGIPRQKIFLVGNVMIDTLIRHRELARQSRILETLAIPAGAPYAVLTLHRPSNVDNRETFDRIARALKHIGKEIPIIFPAHPRTVKMIDTFGMDLYHLHGGIAPSGARGIRILPPLGYLDFLHLMASARVVLTDSGGIQEETTVLGVPCLTLRENTERPVTITEGTNILTGTNPVRIIRETEKILSGRGKKGKIPRLWDGRAATRIIKVIARYFILA